MCIYDFFMWEDTYSNTETKISQKMLLEYMSAIFHTCNLFFINMSPFDFYIFCFTECKWEDLEGCDTFCKQVREVKEDFSTFCNYHFFLEVLIALKVGELSEMH